MRKKYEAGSGDEPRGFIGNYCVMLIALFKKSAFRAGLRVSTRGQPAEMGKVSKAMCECVCGEREREREREKRKRENELYTTDHFFRDT